MIEPNTIHCADCMDGLREMPDNYIDLAIVDPPYGIGVKTNMGRRAGVYNANPVARWDSPMDVEYYHTVMRVSVNQIVWGANHFISKMPYDSPCWLMWDKGFSHDLSFAQFELAWTSFKSVAKKFDMAPNAPGRIHPTQKPVDLYKWLLQNYAKEGDLILDTHMGSGSSYIACLDMGFDYIGYEIDEDYFAAIEQRVYQFTRQTTLEGI